MDEIELSNNSSSCNETAMMEIEYLTVIKKLQEKVNDREELKLFDIEKRFCVDTFDGSQNSIEWINNFKEECLRYGIKEKI